MQDVEGRHEGGASVGACEAESKHACAYRSLGAIGRDRACMGLGRTKLHPGPDKKSV